MNIKKTVEKLAAKYNTDDPFLIANYLGVIVKSHNLGSTLGYFYTYKRFRMIHINENISSSLRLYVCAHELGHAILHNQVNTPFLKAHTFFSVDSIEIEANTFAVELLLPDSYLKEYPDAGIYNLARCRGVPLELIKLKSIHV